MRVPVTVFVVAASLSACAGPLIRPSLAPALERHDALLILPGFGYGRSEGETLRAVAAASRNAGVDLFVAPYLTRSGLATSRARLADFIRENRLDRYERVHVFAFIAGAWTFNPMVERQRIPNLATVIYDRSPFQERAPKIAASRLPLLAWIRYGSTIFDLARTPYAALAEAHVKIGIVVESKPTAFIERYDEAARTYGPFAFGCDSFQQRYDDCLYLPLNHDEVYDRFADVWPEVLAFVRTGRFTEAAARTPPSDDALALRGRR